MVSWPRSAAWCNGVQPCATKLHWVMSSYRHRLLHLNPCFSSEFAKRICSHAALAHLWTKGKLLMPAVLQLKLSTSMLSVAQS